MPAMKRGLCQLAAVPFGFTLLLTPGPLAAADLVHAKDGSGVYGYNDTPVLPWCGYRVHEADRPAPKRIDPGPVPAPGVPPSDALVLFNGKDLAQWQPTDWKVVDGCLEAVGGSSLTTRDQFGSCQIHLEWQAPNPPSGPWYNRGNNGVFLMGLYEIQIFDSHTETIYPDGQAAAVYGQTPPLVNATRAPGEWQVFDIIFTPPLFAGDKLAQPARITMFHNGALVHLNQKIYGETGHRILPEYKQHVSQGPLRLSGHNSPVRFRNIWVRKL
jgi:hypothetical protein